MKKILLFLMIILLTGCNISYELYITKDLNFNEKITIKGHDYAGIANDDEFLEDYFASQVSEVDSYRIIKNESVKGNFEVAFENSVNSTDEFLKVESLSSFYNNNNIYVNESGNYVFDLKRVELFEEEAYTPFVFDKLEVSIHSEKKIINSNADRIVSNKYIWTMDNEVKDIYFELTDEDAFIIPGFVWILSSLLLICVIVAWFMKKSKKINEI